MEGSNHYDRAGRGGVSLDTGYHGRRPRPGDCHSWRPGQEGEDLLDGAKDQNSLLLLLFLGVG